MISPHTFPAGGLDNAPRQLLSQPLQDLDAAFSEAAQEEHAFLSDGVDDVADFLVVEQEIDELSDLDVIDGDLELICPCDDKFLVAHQVP